MAAAEAGRTGRRRIGSEAEPSAQTPEEEPAVDEGEAEPSVTDGVYFSKVPARDVWHAHDEQHEHIGTVYRTDTRWHVKAGRRDMPASFASASSGRAFLSGYHLGRADGLAVSAGSRTLAPSHEPTALRAAREAAEAPTAAKDASTNASHDADA